MLNVVAPLERLVRVKHSSLFQTFVNYGRKKFYNIGPRASSTTITGLKVFVPVAETFSEDQCRRNNI